MEALERLWGASGSSGEVWEALASVSSWGLLAWIWTSWGLQYHSAQVKGSNLFARSVLRIIVHR